MSNNNKALQIKYNQYQSTINEINSKLDELRTDQNEHKIVINTLSSTDKDRRCFRMVGGVLLEKTVEDTIPVLDLKLNRIDDTITALSTELKSIIKEFEEWKTKNHVKILRS